MPPPITYHDIAPSQVAKATPGDFGITIIDDTAFVPQDIANMCQVMGVQNVEELLSLAHSFPSCIIGLLGWTHNNVTLARRAAVQQFTGIVADEFLNPPSPPKRTYGAFAPPKRNSTQTT